MRQSAWKKIMKAGENNENDPGREREYRPGIGDTAWFLLFLVLIPCGCSSGPAEKGEIGGTKSSETNIPALIDDLKSGDRDIQFAAVRELAAQGPEAHGAVPELQEILKDPNAGSCMHRAAAKALIAIGPEGIEVIKKGLDNRLPCYFGNFMREPIALALAEAGAEYPEDVRVLEKMPRFWPDQVGLIVDRRSAPSFPLLRAALIAEYGWREDRSLRAKIEAFREVEACLKQYSGPGRGEFPCARIFITVTAKVYRGINPPIPMRGWGEGGLDWLHINQETDGHWDCAKHGGKKGETYDIAVTGLATMVFLGYGITEENEKPPSWRVGNLTVQGGLNWLIARQKEDGTFSPNNFANGIASIAVIEAYGMGSTERKEAAQKAVDGIVLRQGPSGGWDYGDVPADEWTSDIAWRPGMDRGDMPISCWQVLALKSAWASGLHVPEQALEKARTFFGRISVQYQNSRVAYAVEEGRRREGSDACMAMAGTSLLSLGRGCSDPAVIAICDSLRDRMPDIPGDETDLLSIFWNTLIMFHVGDPYWREWNRGFRDPLVALQERGWNEFVGSWNPQETARGADGGRVYATALACLSLEIYYRYFLFVKHGVD